MVVGLLISILQVVTQVQETSLSFIPKIVSVVFAVIVFGPWMLRKLIFYCSSVIEGIPGYL